MVAGSSAAAIALAASAMAAQPGAPTGAPTGTLSAGRTAQASGGYRQRSVREQDVARDRVQRGELWRLDELLVRAQQVGDGEYLGVEPQAMGDRYRFKFRRASGAVVWVDMDGRTGGVIAVRD